MAENIKDYGGIEGDDSNSAMKANVDAIHEASVAASDNTVYLPEGHWYIGAPDISTGTPLRPGDSAHDRGAVGLGFTGDGPTKSYLKLGYLETDAANSIRYEDDEGSHDNTKWDNITYDGNMDAFSWDASGTTGHWGFRFTNGTAGDVTMENVRIRNWAGNGVFQSGGSSITFTFDRCTFYNHGIKVCQDSDGSSVSHHLAMGESGTVKNCEFRHCSGSVWDANDASSQVTFDNCWVYGVGNGLFKIVNADTIDISKVYFRSETPELDDALGGLSNDQSGGPFIYRLSGDSSVVPVVSINDVEARDMPSFGLSAANGYSYDVEGGTDGPVAFHNISRDFDSGLRAVENSVLSFNQFGEISTHDVDGEVFNASDSTGSISHLKRDNTHGLGDPGDITISTDETNTSAFSPTVPSKSDVGINSSTSTDSAPSGSWVNPSDGDTVSGGVTVQVDASDSEDSDDSLTVEYRVDGNSWTTTSYNADTGYYEDSWDSTTVADGSHTLEARVTDSAGNSSTTSIGVTVDNNASLFDDWTVRWETTKDDWTVVSGSEYEGGKALEFDASSSDRHAISWDAVGEQSDVEALDRVRITESGLLGRLHLRSYGTDGNHNGYWLEFESRENAFRLGKYTDGGYSTLKRFGTIEQDTFYYRRFRAQGDTLKIKVWKASESEPTDWTVELDDTDHSSGWVGIGSYSGGVTHTDTLSVATGGDTAPFVGQNSAPSVSWAAPSDGSTVSGSVTVQVDASDAEDSDDSLTVEYRVDANSWTTTSYNSNTGYYEDSWDTTTVADGDHTLEARATDSAGNTSSTTITVTTDNSGSAPTVDSLSLSEVETSDSDAEFDADWQVSDSDGDLGSVDLVLTQDSDGSTEDSASIGVSGDTASGTTRLVASGDDGSGNGYTVELTVTDSEGNTASDTSSTSETEDSSSPAIDRFSVSEAGRPDPHAEITVVWDVSDADADLASVEIDIADSSGTVQSVTWTVGGATASDTDSFKIKDGDGKTFDVTLTVTDAAGHSTSKTKSVTA